MRLRSSAKNRSLDLEVDSDFPVQMAGERLGFSPMKIRAGLEDGSLRELLPKSAIGSLWPGYLMDVGTPESRCGVLPEVTCA